MAVSYLRLIHDRSDGSEIAGLRFEQIQESLLPVTEHTVALCTADGLNENSLRSFVNNLKPRLVLDFRTAPRFDFGLLDRRKVFDLFDEIGARYLDVGYLADDANHREALAEKLTEYALPLTQEAPNSALLALVNAGVDFESVGLSAVRHLREQTKLIWGLLLFGSKVADDEQRKVVFISHANPEDNEVAFWLQAQLTRLGYEAWSDLTHLKAGELFWDSIEDTIRNKAIRVIALISKKAMQKPGVLDEISLAVSVERTRQLSGFLIPMRLDDVPYSDFRANIARKNIVDLSSGWAPALATLSATLLKDRIPRLRQTQGQSLASWWDEQRPMTLAVVDKAETLTSNRFRVTSLPLRLYSFQGSPEYSFEDALPLVPFKNQWLSFLSGSELSDLGIRGITQASTLATSELFAGNLGLTLHTSTAARQRLLHGMLNRQWLVFLSKRGLKLYKGSGMYPVPYIPDGLIPNNTSHFFDFDGKQRKRILVGYSTKKNLYWHLAPVGTFFGGSHASLNLKLRVIFSSDGQAQWPSVERMRTMRRSFCKNWWNDRWFSLQRTLMGWLSSGSSEILLHSGDGGQLSLRSMADCYRSPISIMEEHANSDEGSPDQAVLSSDNDDWADFDIDTDDDTDSEIASS